MGGTSGDGWKYGFCLCSVVPFPPRKPQWIKFIDLLKFQMVALLPRIAALLPHYCPYCLAFAIVYRGPVPPYCPTIAPCRGLIAPYSGLIAPLLPHYCPTGGALLPHYGLLLPHKGALLPHIAALSPHYCPTIAPRGGALLPHYCPNRPADASVHRAPVPPYCPMVSPKEPYCPPRGALMPED